MLLQVIKSIGWDYLIRIKRHFHEGTKIVDQLQDGQTFKEAVVYTVDVSEQETK